eukprot:4790961-Prymnesium_polylepis.1
MPRAQCGATARRASARHTAAQSQRHGERVVDQPHSHIAAVVARDVGRPQQHAQGRALLLAPAGHPRRHLPQGAARLLLLRVAPRPAAGGARRLAHRARRGGVLHPGPEDALLLLCLLYTSPSPRDAHES